MSAAVLIGAAYFGWQQVDEARKARKDRNRPFVVMDLDWQSRPPFLFLEIANIGRTVAHNVSFQFQPALRSTLYSDPPISDLQLFTNGISVLPPGKLIRVLFDSGPPRNKENLEDHYDVEVSYQSSIGDKFTDPYPIDIAMIREALQSVPKTVEDVVKNLEGILNELKTWSTLGETGLLIRSAGNGASEADELNG